MAKRNVSKYAVLGLLNIMPSSGYDIKKFSNSSIGYFWNENYGNLYPLLKKMEDENLVTKMVEKTSGKPNRNVYSITELGEKDLMEWLTSSTEPQKTRNEFLLKIFFSGNLAKKDIIKQLNDALEEKIQVIKEYEAVKEAVDSKENRQEAEGIYSDKMFQLALATLKYGKMHAETDVIWLNEFIEEVKKFEE